MSDCGVFKVPCSHASRCFFLPRRVKHFGPQRWARLSLAARLAFGRTLAATMAVRMPALMQNQRRRERAAQAAGFLDDFSVDSQCPEALQKSADENHIFDNLMQQHCNSEKCVWLAATKAWEQQVR